MELPFFTQNGETSAIKKEYLIISELLFLALILDLLRWYYGHICELLNPARAVWIAKRESEKMIKKYAQHAKWFSVGCRLLNKDKKNGDSYESAYYLNVPNHINPLKYWIDVLSEMSSKSCARGEMKLASIALRAISEIVQCYLEKRKNNILILPSEIPLVVKTDADNFLDYVYDSLRRISELAIDKKDEITAIEVTKTYVNIAIKTTSLSFSNIYYKYTAPMTYSPLFYLTECIKYAQQKGFDEVVFKSTQITLNGIISFTKNLSIDNIYALIFGWFKDVTVYFLIKMKPDWANEVTARMMKLIFFLLDIEYYQLSQMLSGFFEKITPLVYLSLSYKNNDFNSLGSPLRAVYCLTCPNSIGYFLDSVASKIKIGDKECEYNPYREFIDISEKVWRHFRYLADNMEFGENGLLSEMIETIKYIAKIFIGLIEASKDCGYKDSLVKALKWQLSFLWAVFNKKAKINFHYIKTACDILAYVGIKFSGLYFFAKEIIYSCVSNIISNINSYAELQESINVDNIANLLMYIWYVRSAADKKFPLVVNQIDETLAKFFTNVKYSNCIELFKLEKEKLEEKLKKEANGFFRDSSEDLLMNIVKRAKKNSSA